MAKMEKKYFNMVVYGRKVLKNIIVARMIASKPYIFLVNQTKKKLD